MRSGETTERVWSRTVEAWLHGEPAERRSWPVPKLNALAGGLKAGQVVVLGGPAGAGKATLLIQAAVAWLNEGLRVAWVDPDARMATVLPRWLALAAHVSRADAARFPAWWSRMQQVEHWPQERALPEHLRLWRDLPMARCAMAYKAMRDWPLTWVDAPEPWPVLAHQLESLDPPPQVVVIREWSLLPWGRIPPSERGPAIARGTKALARRLGMPMVLTVSQDFCVQPELETACASADLAGAADQVWWLDRDGEGPVPGSGWTPVRLRLLKHRLGPRGTWRGLRFMANGSFVDRSA
ncbi:MAG: AAA family ATPase [Firmicutes bacterium]|nr:AAA family ATPase [Bacillota bacterium]